MIPPTRESIPCNIQSHSNKTIEILKFTFSIIILSNRYHKFLVWNHLAITAWKQNQANRRQNAFFTLTTLYRKTEYVTYMPGKYDAHTHITELPLITWRINCQQLSENLVSVSNLDVLSMIHEIFENNQGPLQICSKPIQLILQTKPNLKQKFHPTNFFLLSEKFHSTNWSTCLMGGLLSLFCPAMDHCEEKRESQSILTPVFLNISKPRSSQNNPTCVMLGVNPCLLLNPWASSPLVCLGNPMCIIQTIAGVSKKLKCPKSPLGTCACNIALVLGPLLNQWFVLLRWSMCVPTMFDPSNSRQPGSCSVPKPHPMSFRPWVAPHTWHCAHVCVLARVTTTPCSC